RSCSIWGGMARPLISALASTRSSISAAFWGGICSTIFTSCIAGGIADDFAWEEGAAGRARSTLGLALEPVFGARWVVAFSRVMVVAPSGALTDTLAHCARIIAKEHGIGRNQPSDRDDSGLSRGAVK